MLRDQLNQALRVALHAGGRNDKACAAEEGREDLPHGGIKADGGLLDEDVLGSQLAGGHHPVDKVHQPSSFKHCALGTPSRACITRSPEVHHNFFFFRSMGLRQALNLLQQPQKLISGGHGWGTSDKLFMLHRARVGHL